MRRQVKFLMINTLDFKTGWKAKVTVRNRTTTENMNLRLYWNCRSFRDAVKVGTIVMREKRVVAVSKATRGFIRVEAGFVR